MTVSNFNISSDKPTQHFTNFLSQFGNDRIIFSGIFGIGKTTFLKNFFEIKKDKFVAIHLYPTNYSVASNEDIFEYIKFDILYSLLQNKVYLEKIDPSSYDIINFMSYQDSYKLFKSFLKCIPTLGHRVTEVINPVEELVVHFEETTKKINELIKVNEGKLIENYISKIESQKGSIYDNDFYTQLITELIKQLKNVDSEKPKEVILIVDDLDRIDPEHIFRIVNIFAVHFDANNDSQNKFGLDRIVLSCDINNIREIFRHKYGNSVDFNGYIDKFYSKEIYKFDNKENIQKCIETLIQSINIRKEILNQTGTPYWQNPSLIENDLLIYIITSFIFSNKLNLRALKKLIDITYNPEIYDVWLLNTGKYSNYKIPLFYTFDFLSFLFGSVENLVESSKQITFIDFNNKQSIIKYAFSNFAFYLDSRQPNVESQQPNENTFPFSYSLTSTELFQYRIKQNLGIPRFTAVTNANCTYEQFIKLFNAFIIIYEKKRNKLS